MTARIFRPSKTAMQSGTAKTKNWVLVHEAETARSVEPLMGWTSSSDTNTQVRMTFPSKEDAIAYAKRQGLTYKVEEPKERRPKSLSYSDNFKANRRTNWTH